MKRLLAIFVSMLCMLGIQAQNDRQQITWCIIHSYSIKNSHH